MATVKQIAVRIFAAPDASCAQGSTWHAVTRIIGEHLKHRFGDAVQIEHVEVFSARSFEFPEVLEAVKAGGALPVVVVDDRIVSHGGKLSERTIAQAIASLLPPGAQIQETQK